MRFSNFSNQFNPQSGILQLMNDLGQAGNSQHPVCMLGGGNPASIAKMERIFRTQMNELLGRDREFESMLGGYDAPQGNLRFCQALSDFLQQHMGWPITAENIAITNGSQSSFALLFNLFAGEFADKSFKQILLPLTPEYIGYSDLGLGKQSIFSARRPKIEKLGQDQFKYRLDFQELNAGKNIGAICVSRPTNPTGNVIADEELEELRIIARSLEVPLIIDGAYGLPFPGITFSKANPIWDEHIILCLSLSKLGLPGIRTGIVVAPQQVIEKITASNAIFNLAPGRFGPTLMTPLLQSGDLLGLCDNIIRPYYHQRSREAISMVQEAMADLPVRIHKSEGAIFLWLWFEGLPITSQTLYQRLKARNVMIIPGHHFFPGLDDQWQHCHECIRMSYAASAQDVREGIGIISEEVRLAYN